MGSRQAVATRRESVAVVAAFSGLRTELYRCVSFVRLIHDRCMKIALLLVSRSVTRQLPALLCLRNFMEHARFKSLLRVWRCCGFLPQRTKQWY